MSDITDSRTPVLFADCLKKFIIIIIIIIVRANAFVILLNAFGT